jgi:hypothetical protein
MAKPCDLCARSGVGTLATERSVGGYVPTQTHTRVARGAAGGLTRGHDEAPTQAP